MRNKVFQSTGILIANKLIALSDYAKLVDILLTSLVRAWLTRHRKRQGGSARRS